MGWAGGQLSGNQLCKCMLSQTSHPWKSPCWWCSCNLRCHTCWYHLQLSQVGLQDRERNSNCGQSSMLLHQNADLSECNLFASAASLNSVWFHAVYPGTEAPFELRLLSSQAIELVPLPEVHTISHVGEWNIGSAGGCNIHQSWTSNPAFPLKLQRRSACK